MKRDLSTFAGLLAEADPCPGEVLPGTGAALNDHLKGRFEPSICFWARMTAEMRPLPARSSTGATGGAAPRTELILDPGRQSLGDASSSTAARPGLEFPSGGFRARPCPLPCLANGLSRPNGQPSWIPLLGTEEALIATAGARR